MVQLSPRVATDAEAGDIFMNFSMENAFYDGVHTLLGSKTFSHQEPEIVVLAPEMGIEVEVETDTSDEPLMLVLPQETLLMVPDTEQSCNLVEVQSTFETDPTPLDYSLQTPSRLFGDSLDDQVLYSTVSTAGLDLSHSLYSDFSMKSSCASNTVCTPTSDMVGCDPAAALGTLPLESTTTSMTSVQQTINLEEMPWGSLSPSSSASDSASDGTTQSSFLEETLDGALDDADLARAALDAMKTGKMTSLIKEELRCIIQSQRLQEGKEELASEELDMQVSEGEEELSIHDVERRKQRRGRNRVAAQKCRQRKRERTEELEGEVEVLRQKKLRYNSDIKALETERIKLTQMLQNHDAFPGLCTRRLSGSDS